MHTAILCVCVCVPWAVAYLCLESTTGICFCSREKVESLLVNDHGMKEQRHCDIALLRDEQVLKAEHACRLSGGGI